MIDSCKEILYYCDNCNKELSKLSYKRGQGLCPICIGVIN